MSRGNSSLLKEHAVAMNCHRMLKFYNIWQIFIFEDETGLEVRKVFDCETQKIFAKPISCNEVCSVDLVASRCALCDDGFEYFFWRVGGWGVCYYCLRECVYSSVMVAALLVLRDGAYYHNGNHFLFTRQYHVIAHGGTVALSLFPVRDYESAAEWWHHCGHARQLWCISPH